MKKYDRNQRENRGRNFIRENEYNCAPMCKLSRERVAVGRETENVVANQRNTWKKYEKAVKRQ